MALTEVNSLGIKDGEVKTADLAADAVTGAKIADDAIDSEHYTDGSIDHAHLANDCVDGDNIADDSINSEHYVDGSIDTAHIADDQVTLAKMASGTDGVIITYDASGNPVHVGPGTDGQVLTSTGAGSPPAFEDAAASVGGASGVDFNDNVKARFGTGNDLEIFHNGSHSHITDSGTGDLTISSSRVVIANAANSEACAKFIENGAVELYHDDTKVVETDSDGIQFDDGKGCTFGTDDDYRIYHGADAKWIFELDPTSTLNVKALNNDATNNIPLMVSKSGSASNNERHSMISFALPGNHRGIIQSGSSISEAPALVASSDYRVKENFRPYTGGWDAIKAIPVQLYDEKSPSYWAQGTDKKDQKGWKAHEVQAVIPEAVSGVKDAVVTQAMIDSGQYQQSELNQIIPQQLGPTAMIPTLIGALQQAMAKIETLETKVAALEAG